MKKLALTLALIFVAAPALIAMDDNTGEKIKSFVDAKYCKTVA